MFALGPVRGAGTVEVPLSPHKLHYKSLKTWLIDAFPNDGRDDSQW